MDRLKDMLKNSTDNMEADDFEEKIEEEELEDFDEDLEQVEELEEWDEEDSEEFEQKEQDGYIVKAFTIEEGLEKACEELNVPITDLEYEIIEKSSAGFLGIGRKPFVFKILTKASNTLQDTSLDLSDFGQLDETHILPENIDGEFKVRFTKQGILLKVIKPKGKGKPIQINAVIDFLNLKGINNAPMEAVRTVVNKGEGTYVKIADFQGNPAADAVCNVEISENEMHAYVRMSPPGPKGRTLEYDDMINVLTSRGVVEGISQNAIDDMLEKEVYNQSVEVATGIPSQDGEDSTIEYKFKTGKDKMHLHADKDSGKIDFHDLNLVENVVVGQVLAVKNPAEKGIPGKTVTGQNLPAKDGTDVPLPLGKGTKPGDDNLQIIADINGQVVLSKGLVTVEAIYEVPGDVGLSTGNITFLGTVLVHGAVEDGFSIKASGNIEVRGSVGKATLEAEGDIILKQGLAGKDEAKIISGHDIYAKFMEHAKLVKAENDIIATEGLLHSIVRAGRRIVCNGKRGMIVGGEVIAGEEINAKIIGSQSYTETIIETGVDPRSREELTEFEQERAELRDTLKEVSLNVNTLLSQKKSARGKLNPEKEEMLASMSQEKDEKTKRLSEIEERIGELKSYLNALEEKGKVSVQKTTFPKVKIIIKNAALEVRDEFSYVTFVQEAGNIKVLPYQEAVVADKMK